MRTTLDLDSDTLRTSMLSSDNKRVISEFADCVIDFVRMKVKVDLGGEEEEDMERMVKGGGENGGVMYHYLSPVLSCYVSFMTEEGPRTETSHHH